MTRLPGCVTGIGGRFRSGQISCPTCGQAGLEARRTLTLPPDGRSDDIIMQLWRCRECRQPVVAVYEESRRGRLDQESWEHTGYLVTEVAYRRLEALALQGGLVMQLVE